MNMCYHKEDFGLDCEWHFFATAHGKSACDGVGGTIKRIIGRLSLQRPVDNQITTPMDMFEEAKKTMKNIR